MRITSGAVDAIYERAGPVTEYIVRLAKVGSPRRKLERVAALNRAVEQLAAARLRARYGEEMSERELRLRLGALRLDRRVMVEAFGWDPHVRGL